MHVHRIEIRGHLPSENEDGVREVAMRAGQVVVSSLGMTHSASLLPALCDGMISGAWRIRSSSVLLFCGIEFSNRRRR